jgi:hypothetical protein
MAETVFARLLECNCHSLPVIQRDQLVGIVTAGNVGEFLMVQAALRPWRAVGGSGWSIHKPAVLFIDFSSAYWAYLRRSILDFHDMRS